MMTENLDYSMLLKVAEQFDSPVYVYNAEKIISQYKRLVNAFKPIDIKVKYACKALELSHSKAIKKRRKWFGYRFNK
jgi:diaminopimelate decarboxylase